MTSPETEVEKDSIFTFIKLLCSMVVRAINKQDQRPKAGLQHQIKMNTFEKQIYKIPSTLQPNQNLFHSNFRQSG